jgi:CBS domain-containing protein
MPQPRFHFTPMPMPEPLPLDSPLFSLLKPDQRAALQHACAAATFEAGATLLSPLVEPTHAFIIAQGHVQQIEPGYAAQVHGPGEMLAVREVLAGRANGQWTAIGAVAAHAIPKNALQALIAANSAFTARLFGDIARRLSAVAQSNEKRELLSLMMVRIGDAYVRKPFYVDGSTDILSVCRLLASHDLTNVLVRDGERVGMFTTTDLREALLRGVPPAELAVREVAQFALISVHPDSDLFDALLMMVRHRVHRLLVRDGDMIVGVLSQLDLMSFVSNHSHIIALKIEQSETIDDLRAAALQMDGLVALLQGGGVRVEVITALVSELNTRVFARLWSFIAPQELVENSCLVVMGSEGRGEQILKTDQDNALLLRDGFVFPDLAGVAQQFNSLLAEFGYPQCPGDIMITNPLWRQPLAAFRETIGGWLYGADPQGVMHLAIFCDAVAIAGDAALLHDARRYLESILSDDANFLARFARAADQFTEPGHWWAWLTPRRDESPLDLKKLGTFPIVHGVRALALQYRITALSTAQRVRALVDQQHLNAELARDLLDALHFLMGLKLKCQLRQRQIGEPASNLVLPSALGTLERDMLKDSLAIIKRFRQHLYMHFRLGAV